MTPVCIFRPSKRALAEIEKTGYLTVEKRGGSLLGGRRQATEYVAAFPTTGSTGRPVAQDDRYSCALLPVAEDALTGSTERPQDVKKAPKKAPGDLAALEIDFNAVWITYPRKVDRGKALRAFKARRHEGAQQCDLLAATQNYAKATSGTDPKYIKHGSSFFGRDKPFAEYIDGCPEERPGGGTVHPEVTW